MESPLDPDASTPPAESPQPQSILRFGANWSHIGVPEHPHEAFAMRGWHSISARESWDIPGLIRDFHDTLQYSDCSPTGDPPELTDTSWQAITFAPADGVIVIARPSPHGAWLLSVWAHTHERALHHFRDLSARYRRKKKRPGSRAYFSVVTASSGHLGSRTIVVTPKLRSRDDVALHYGPQFVDWHLQFISKLRRLPCGLTILRGEPGTGKTSYLRFLMKVLRRTHRFYYLPLNVYPLLSNPATLGFWLERSAAQPRRKMVVILEDAETLLMQRADDNQDRVSDLLNMSDGLLGDALKLQVICTVNSGLDNMDPALMRPGRLIDRYQFERLPPQLAVALAEAKRLPIAPSPDYSLAELYCGANGGSKRVLGFEAARG